MLAKTKLTQLAILPVKLRIVSMFSVYGSKHLTVFIRMEEIKCHKNDILEILLIKSMSNLVSLQNHRLPPKKTGCCS